MNPEELENLTEEEARKIAVDMTMKSLTFIRTSIHKSKWAPKDRTYLIVRWNEKIGRKQQVFIIPVAQDHEHVKREIVERMIENGILSPWD